nr:PREDICTED: E3 ubiquitin-protein ligase RNF135 [Bos mutus]
MSDSLIEDEFDLTSWFNYENWHSQLDCVVYILPVLNELILQLQTFEEMLWVTTKLNSRTQIPVYGIGVFLAAWGELISSELAVGLEKGNEGGPEQQRRRSGQAETKGGACEDPLSPGPEPTPAPRPASRPGRPTAQLRVEAPKSSTEVDRELAKLVERLINIVRKLQSPRHLLESEPDKEVSILAMTLLDGVDLSLASPKVSSSPPEQKMKDILHDLEEIQEKLRENFTQKGALEEQTQVELPEVPSSSSCPLPDQSRFAPKKTSSFARWAISPTFDLESLSCNLKVSVDRRTVTVSDFPMLYAWSPERFASSQALCSQALSSGQHYWEVDTQRCSHWAVGVASRGMKRDQILGRTTDSWCVEWKGASQLSAWCMVKETVLSSDRPSVVGIWLDLEEGKLAFYSKADQAKPLFECPISVSVPLHPAFWLYGLDPGNSLTIRKMNV